jgi:hypothetical protein
VITRQFNLIILLTLCCFSLTASSAEQQGEEYLLKAVFIYNFAKFTRWPVQVWDNTGRSLRICSVGNDNLTKVLVKLHGRTLRDYPVIIELLEDTSDLDSCHVLYLANSHKYDVLSIIDSIYSKPILTVSELPGFTESGGMIELYHNEDRIRFKVNLRIIRESGLDLSSSLLKLADIVNR